jgi:hypothetical protein
MKNWTKQIFCFFMSFVLISFFYSFRIEACESISNQFYAIKKDSLGRLITIKKSYQDKSLQVTIDQESSKIISMPSQECYEFLSEVTSEGDIVVLWLAIDSDKQIYSLYTAILPFGKEWTKPICLSPEEECIIPKSLKLIVNSIHDIVVFWESSTIFESTKNSQVLGHKRELRSVSGTIEAWGQVSTSDVLYNSENS